MSQLQKIKIKEHAGYYFSYDPEDPFVPVTVHSNWRKTGKTPAVIDETYSRPLKSADDRDRLYVTIATMGKKERLYLDTMVASYLISNPHNHQRVIHKDGSIYNCHPSNLKWASKEEYTVFAASINRAKGRIKRFLATYTDGTTEVVTGFLDFLKKKNIPEHILYQLRKGEISEYNGLISFEEIDREIKGKSRGVLEKKFDLTGFDIVELDDWPGYYVVYKKEDANTHVRIFSRWKKEKEGMFLCENFVRETIQHIHVTGYPQVNMKLPGEKKIVQKLHRLVAKQLVENPDPENFDTVDHINNDKTNSHPSNLQWITLSGNTKKAVEDGLFKCNDYEITFSDGRVETISNLRKFCNERNYNSAGCYNVINNKQPAHKDIIKITKSKYDKCPL
jgi:predicted transcriptional regulator